jgi:hypothetical protein
MRYKNVNKDSKIHHLAGMDEVAKEELFLSWEIQIIRVSIYFIPFRFL